MPAVAEDVNVVEPPEQNDTVPDIVGVEGIEFTVTPVPADVEDAQLETVEITV